MRARDLPLALALAACGAPATPRPAAPVVSTRVAPTEVAAPAAAPRFFEVTDARCVDHEVRCIRHAGLPAIATDGTRIAGLMETLDVVLVAGAAIESEAWRLDLIDARTGEVERSLPVRTSLDNAAWTEAQDPTVCDDVAPEEPCNAGMGEVLEELREPLERESRARFVERVAAIEAAMGDPARWRSLTPDGVSADVEAEGDDPTTLELVAWRGGREVLRREVTVCEDCTPEATAWLDPPTGVVLVRLVAQTADAMTEDLRWFVVR